MRGPRAQRWLNPTVRALVAQVFYHFPASHVWGAPDEAILRGGVSQGGTPTSAPPVSGPTWWGAPQAGSPGLPLRAVTAALCPETPSPPPSDLPPLGFLSTLLPAVALEGSSSSAAFGASTLGTGKWKRMALLILTQIFKDEHTLP